MSISDINNLPYNFEKVFLDSIPEGVLVSDKDQVTLYCNAAFTEITGYSQEEMCGRNCNLLQGPGTDPHTRATIAQAIVAGKPFRGAILNYRKDGSTFWNDLSIAPLRNEQRQIVGYISVQRDITTFKEQEADLRIAAHAFDVDEGIIITDPERRIIRVNPAFCRLTGYGPEEVIGKTPAIISSGRHDRAFYASMWESIREQGFWRGEIWNRRKNGEIYPELLTITAIHDSGGIVQNYVAHFQDITERIAQEEQLRYLALHDSLTGLFNRYALDQEIDRAISRAERLEKLLVLCLMDLDGFKPVNDTYGHEAGNEVLAILGKRLSETLRRTDFAARLGGDEFVVLLEYLERLDGLELLLEKMEKAVKTPILLRSGETVSVGVSIGVAIHFPDETDDAGGEESLLRLADQALYEAKAHKADREHSWAFFGEERKTPLTPERRLLDAGALEVWYQPVLSGDSHKVVGVEALARLRDDDGSILYPAEFLPGLSAYDLMNLSSMVLTQALGDLKKLDDLGWRLWVSFNVAPESFCGNVVPCLQSVIDASGVDPQRIILEILESSDFLERKVSLSVLHDIKELGIRLALDDVGSAYASLLRLKELPIDEIKLDQGFVRFLEKRPQDLHFVRTIQELSSDLQMDLVVEGVETPDILDAMLTTGVPYMQGYAISRPLPLDALQRFLSVHTIDTHIHPTSLFGFYAATIKSHAAIKNILILNEKQLNISSLADGHQCRGHGVLHSFGYGEDSHLVQLHNIYHRALGAIAMDTGNRELWKVMELALNEFLQAILEAGIKPTSQKPECVISPPDDRDNLIFSIGPAQE